jgi:hypothetical protein
MDAPRSAANDDTEIRPKVFTWRETRAPHPQRHESLLDQLVRKVWIVRQDHCQSPQRAPECPTHHRERGPIIVPKTANQLIGGNSADLHDDAFARLDEGGIERFRPRSITIPRLLASNAASQLPKRPAPEQPTNDGAAHRTLGIEVQVADISKLYM